MRRPHHFLLSGNQQGLQCKLCTLVGQPCGLDSRLNSATSMYHSNLITSLQSEVCSAFQSQSKQTVRSLGGPEFPVDNHKSSVASEGSGQECRAGITVRPTHSPLSFLRDRGSLSHKLLHQEETTQNCCRTNAHLGIVCQCVRFTFDGSVASLPFPPV